MRQEITDPRAVSVDVLAERFLLDKARECAERWIDNELGAWCLEIAWDQDPTLSPSYKHPEPLPDEKVYVTKVTIDLWGALHRVVLRAYSVLDQKSGRNHRVIEAKTDRGNVLIDIELRGGGRERIYLGCVGYAARSPARIIS